MLVSAKSFSTLVLLCATMAALPCPGATPNVVAWGAGTNVAHPPDFNNYGQSMVSANLSNAVQVAGGWRHSLALRTNGSIFGWGDSTFGQTFFPPGPYMAIAAGQLHSLGLRTDGQVVAEGDDYWGQCEVPTNLSNVVAVAGGFYHSLALKSDGTVVAWGTSTNIATIGTDPSYGQSIVPTNLSGVVAIAAGGWHSMALKANGTLQGWGRNDSLQADVPASVSNIVAISAGAAHNLALRGDGTVAAWGQNTYGQTNVPASLSNVVAIAAGGWHSLALKSDGTVVAWGAGGPSTNANVACGQNVVPAGLTNVIQVAAGSVHSLGLIGTNRPATSAMMTGPTFATNTFSVSVPTRNGRVYRLEYKESLNETNWTTLPLKAGTGGELLLIDPGAGASAQRFYRVRQW